MTADTTTPSLGLMLQGTGNNNNAWGQDLNDQVITKIDQAVAGLGSISGLTGGTYNATAAESLWSKIFLSGTLTSDLTITVPDVAKSWTIYNGCSGAFSVLFKALAGANIIELPVSRFTEVVAFGNANVFRIDGHLIGEIFYHAATVPPGAVECDGTLYKRAAKPSLYAVIGTTYGSTDSTNFAVPNLTDTGRFLRSRTASVAFATYQSNQNKSHTHTGSGTTSVQSASHTHTGSGTTTGASVGHTHTGSGTTSGASVGHTHTGSGTTSSQSASHTHSGTTSGASVDHTHTGSGTTAAMSANATHSHALGAAQNAFITAVFNGGGANQGNLVCTSASVSAGLTTSSTNTDHTHTYSFTTSGVSADHTHTITTGTESGNHTHTYSFTTSDMSVDHTHTYSFTTSGVSADHTHTYSFTTATESGNHTHTYSFTTSTGSADGTEARPEAMVAIACIRY
jgi:microcystin-dependent protein